jgi:hypothetical protein
MAEDAAYPTVAIAAGTNGGIAVFLCANLGNGPAGTQLCPAPPAMRAGVT